MRVGKECLSQWYAASFVVDGIRYPTSEHFMRAEKAKLFRDNEALAKIIAAPGPTAAKRYGWSRSVRGFDEPTWAEHRFRIVVECSIEKFRQNIGLRDYLRGTKNRIRVEASPTDPIWGIGRSADSPHAKNPLAWRCLNLLGFALVTARESLSSQRER